MLPLAGLSTINSSTWEMNLGNNFNQLEEVGGSLKSSESSTTLYSAQPSRGRHVHAKNFLIGSIAGLEGSMLGSKELTRIFPSKTVGVHVVTWNMASQKSHVSGSIDSYKTMQKYPEDLADLCYPISICESAGIFAICLQEISPDKNELLIRLQATLGPRHVLFSYAFQGTLGLLIFLSRDLIWYTSVPQSTGITTRANIRTKGAVAICFILFGTSLLFVSSHFKANPGNLDLRIHDYKEVVRSLNLPKVGLERGYRQKHKSTLDRFDAVFWAGDLNFRLQKTRRQVENMLRTERKSSVFDHLLNFDELVSTQLKGQVFQQFEEGRIRFPPTYKYDINSDNFDTSEKCRVPAYTDRILYKVQKKGTVCCLHYDSIRTIRSSDHRPVYGYYTVCLKPGCDNVALAAGAFHRDIYIAAHGEHQVTYLKRDSERMWTDASRVPVISCFKMIDGTCNERRALHFDLIRPRPKARTKLCSVQ